MKKLALGLLCACAVHAAEIPLVNSHRASAPLEVKGKSPAASLSRSERKELAQEFRGLLSLGTRNDPFSQWKGRSMADCYASERATDRWKQKCEIITGQGNGLFYFYDREAAAEPTLRRVEIFMQTSDEAFLNDVRPTLRQLFGQRERAVPERAGLQALGTISNWTMGSEVADLYLDAAVSVNGTVHFVWSR